jgi:hypothetical protein
VSARRLAPLSGRAERLARELTRYEAKVALLDRARPLNLTSELARLGAAFGRGERPSPAFQYGPPAELGALRRALDEAARALEPGDAEEALVAGRARELELEAQLAEHLGTARFSELASERFPLPDDSEVRSLAERFAAASDLPRVGPVTLHRSDDARDPQSLWSQIASRVGKERWPIRIEVTVGLVSLAAVADGVVRVRPAALLSARAAARIALHEVEGHVRPRVAGAALGGVFSAGSARSSEDEEGRSIWLEEQGGLLDPERRRELARRYFAVESLRQGADLWDTVEVLGRRGATVTSALELAARVHRGGGLGRELVYLAGYARVARQFASTPALERVMRCGRLSLDAAALLRGSLQLDDDGDVI